MLAKLVFIDDSVKAAGICPTRRNRDVLCSFAVAQFMDYNQKGLR